MRAVELAILVVAGLVGWWLEPGLQAFAAPDRPVRLPVPHAVPVLPGGTALRLAMVHDVLCERYPRLGAAWQEARAAKRRATLDAQGWPATADGFLAMDDLAASLDLLGRADEAVTVMRRKLALLPEAQQRRLASRDNDAVLAGLLAQDGARRYEWLAKPLAADDLPAYNTAANLGTYLVHAALAPARGGDPSARERVREGRDLIARAILLHPGSHFGREIWQLHATDWMIAGLDRRDLPATFDLIGNRLLPEAPLPATARVHISSASVFWPRPAVDALAGEAMWSASRRASIREHGITPVGAEAGYADLVPSLLRQPMPFDEPVLAFLGVWMHGSGPNPHIALCLGSIMERVGQRVLAWEAYARALTLAERFSADATLRERLMAHCHARQAAIVAALAAGPQPIDAATLERGFAAALESGTAFQRDLQRVVADRLSAGADCDDPALASAFLASRPPIATRPGEEEWLLISGSNYGDVHRWRLATVVICVLWFCLCLAVGRYLGSRRARSRHARARPPAA